MKKIQKGVTIVEILVYIGLLSMFMLVLLDVFTAIMGAKLESQSTSTVNQDTRYILSKLAYDIENADTISTPSSFGVAGNSLVLTTGGSTHFYSLDGSGNLNLSVGGVPMKLNGIDTEITNISFTKIGNSSIVGNKPTIKVSYTVRSRIIETSGLDEQTINTTLGLR